VIDDLVDRRIDEPENWISATGFQPLAPPTPGVPPSAKGVSMTARDEPRLQAVRGVAAIDADVLAKQEDVAFAHARASALTASTGVISDMTVSVAVAALGKSARFFAPLQVSGSFIEMFEHGVAVQRRGVQSAETSRSTSSHIL
jgi:hypothetical protein